MINELLYCSFNLLLKDSKKEKTHLIIILPFQQYSNVDWALRSYRHFYTKTESFIVFRNICNLDWTMGRQKARKGGGGGMEQTT